MYIDSHCHLNSQELKSNIASILQAMKDTKVDGALCACTTLEEFDEIHQLAQTYPNIWGSVGVHPDYSDVSEPSLDDLLIRGRHSRIVAIGETGLDYYRLNGRTMADLAWQRDRFRIHIRAGRQLNKPLIIHMRSAVRDTMAILQEERSCAGAHEVRGVFHCFTEAKEVARTALDMGLYISLSGVVTFKNALSLKEVARMVPLDRMLIETDSPYLAPTPHRGKTNTPAYVSLVAEHIAELRNISVEEIAQATTDNFYKLFTISKPSINT
jgi:TatD DNase family protein